MGRVLSGWGIVGVALAIILAGTTLAAQTNTSVHDQARTLTKQLMSPFCPGLLLSDCPSPRAFELRAEIEQRLATGESTSAVTKDLVHRFGSAIIGEPPVAGFGLTFWAGLVAAAIASLVLVVSMATVGRRRRHPGDSAPDETPVRPSARTSQLALRLAEELRDMD